VREITDPIVESLQQAGNLLGTLDRNPAELTAVVERLKTQRRELGQVLKDT
jgi:hypothetical protein